MHSKTHLILLQVCATGTDKHFLCACHTLRYVVSKKVLPQAGRNILCCVYSIADIDWLLAN